MTGFQDLDRIFCIVSYRIVSYLITGRQYLSSLVRRLHSLSFSLFLALSPPSAKCILQQTRQQLIHLGATGSVKKRTSVERCRSVGSI